MRTHPRLLIIIDGTSSSTAPRRRRHLVVDGTSSSTAPRRRRHLVVDGTSSSTAPRRRRTLAMGSYILGWLRLTDAVWPSSRPSLYLIVPLRFRFRPAST